ncbi:hypothetical protein OJAV_G00183280 [Oryzias javanicus]|uniref:Uncharacterized protein n=1 Tax=Oryzias javanicus TaxID=123683 RepID=A0A437CEE9_ORYJA|nr:hypothetical protein OJAV_G00183280 [Oryzias javanicus]
MPEAATERRRRTCGCPGQKCLLFLSLLMTWFYIRCVFNEKRLETLSETVKNAIKNAKTYALMLAENTGKEEVEKQLNINHDLSSLLDDAASITNENQLEMFQFYLQKLADIIKTVKLTEQQNILMSAKTLHVQIMAKQETIKKEGIKRWPINLDVLFYNLFHTIEEFKMYFDLEVWSYTVEAEDIERKLENYYISEFKHKIPEDPDFYASEYQDELHDEL